MANKCKRFVLFIFPDHEASGGFGDYVESFDTLEELKAYTPKASYLHSYMCVNIVDLEDLSKAFHALETELEERNGN